MKLAVVIPCYHWVSTTFLSNLLMLDGIGTVPMAVTNGVYLTAAMVELVKAASQDDSWERLLVIEQDMILPKDVLKLHANHKEPIVGSIYFRHSLPHDPIFGFTNNQGTFDLPDRSVVEALLRKPRNIQVGAVGMGCTSIRRDVLDSWPSDEPMFTFGMKKGNIEISHDFWFCMKAKERGFDTYLDSGILCGHLTEDTTGPIHYMAAAHLNQTPEPTRKPIQRIR